MASGAEEGRKSPCLSPPYPSRKHARGVSPGQDGPLGLDSRLGVPVASGSGGCVFLFVRLARSGRCSDVCKLRNAMEQVCKALSSTWCRTASCEVTTGCRGK